MKTQFNAKPKNFRSDRGGEYLSNKFQDYLSDNGIKFECTVCYAPEQNGVAERKNRTLVEAVRALLSSSSLPKRFWAEAMNNACQTFNCIPNDELNRTPYEKFFNKKPKMDLYEFGCEVFVMIPTQLRKKLGRKAERMRFLGNDINLELGKLPCPGKIAQEIRSFSCFLLPIFSAFFFLGNRKFFNRFSRSVLKFRALFQR